MTKTLQDVAYQLGLRIDGDPVSGCIENRQSQTKWTVKLTWFCNMVCGELEQDASEERLMRYTKGYIMQLIGGILFPDASDSRVHIRWLPLVEDLEACGRLSWGSAVLA
ncbi:protein MAIN-LIKE 2-like [Arachis stenosperma]|uniref:protein MAIN-LIKE 2-like n=1 Tax=Arachis stenosperma TaxID=217475 RepID=UPI0025AC400C|nr:protein MAIN-LIKE 2-like [Arachis stenosperma]